MNENKPHIPREARLPNQGKASAILADLLCKGLETKAFDAVLVPMLVPAKDGYAHILTKDLDLVRSSSPFPPIMTVPGGDVLRSLTRRGKSELKVAAVLRPCEMRAAIELVKLGQVDLKNLITITMDCPGALPLSDFSMDPAGELAKFERVERWDDKEDVRPICRICTEFSMTAGDLHLGMLETGGSTVPLMTNSDKGDKVLAIMGMAVSEDVGPWNEKVDKVRELRQHQREAWRRSFEPQIKGTENLLKTLSSCINCHNCMRVCPVCYCRICVFDSERLQHKAEDYLDQAKRKGSLRFPPDMLLFHMGRMSHIALTCVSCGACEDACPASIPIAQMFSLVAEDAQTAFGYRPGRDKGEPLPLTVYREEELEGDKND